MLYIIHDIASKFAFVDFFSLYCVSKTQQIRKPCISQYSTIIFLNIDSVFNCLLYFLSPPLTSQNSYYSLNSSLYSFPVV